MARTTRLPLLLASLSLALGCGDDSSDPSSAETESTGMVSTGGPTAGDPTSGQPTSTSDDASTTDIEPGTTSSNEETSTGPDASSSTGGSLDTSTGTTGTQVETTLDISRIGRYAPEPLSDLFDEGAAEIAAYDPVTQSLFVTNGMTDSIDVLDLSDPTTPTFVQSIGTDDPTLAGPTSVAVAGGVVAAAFPADDDVSAGHILFFDVDGTALADVEVGVLPDMVTFSPDGTRVVVANEGEPTGYAPGDVDPEGSISIIDVSGGVDSASVTTVGFNGLTEDDLDESTRVFGPGSSIAQDLEPEYVAISADGSTAWVSLQENNAIAIVDLDAGTLTGVVGAGFQDHSVVPLDPSDRDDTINIRTGPVLGMRQPDAIAAFSVDGVDYIVAANEGDAREYDGLEEEARIADLTLDPTAFPNAADLQQDEAFGRLNATNVHGDDDGDGDFDSLYAFGSRSVTIYDAAGTLVWDSEDLIEQTTAEAFPADFNANNDENDSFESRSDNKGPEPEGLTVGEAFGVPYLFVGLERIGGFMTWDISDPSAPVLHSYINDRDFDGDAEAGTAGDLAPEGVLYIPAADSATENPLLVITYEVSGTVSIYELTEVPKR